MAPGRHLSAARVGRRAARAGARCTAAPRTPTPGTPSPSPSTARSWPSTCPATATPTDPPRAASTCAGNATDVAAAIERLAPDARAVVGMSLGGPHHDRPRRRRIPSSCAAVVLVDVTPEVERARRGGDRRLRRRPGDASPTSTSSSPARWSSTRRARSPRCGAASSTTRCSWTTASWVWRYRRFTADAGVRSLPAEDLWEALGRIAVPVMLVRGMRTGSVVDDDAEAELLRRLPVGTRRARGRGRPQRAGRRSARAGRAAPATSATL